MSRPFALPSRIWVRRGIERAAGILGAAQEEHTATRSWPH